MLDFLWEIRFPICLLFLLVVVVLLLISSRLWRGLFFRKIPYLVTLGFIIFSTIFVIDKFYINPSNLNKTFSNANTTLIEHHGFEFPNAYGTLKLANLQAPKSERKNDKTYKENKAVSTDALFESIYGTANLDASGNLQIAQALSEPLFVKNKNENRYQLLNNYAPNCKIDNEFTLFVERIAPNNAKKLITEKLFTLTRTGDNTFSFSIFDNGIEKKNENLKLDLNWGIRFSRLFNRLDKAASAEFQELVSGSYIVANNVNRHLKGSELLFFPGPNLQKALKVSCTNGTSSQDFKFKTTINYQLDNGSAFFFGLGDDRNNHKLRFNSDNKGFSLDLSKPTRHPLKSEPKQETNLFVTSNYSIAANKTDLTGGYLFPWFEKAEHKLNVDGNIFYKTSNANNKLEIQFSTESARINAVNELYKIPTEKANASWKFKFNNLKELSHIKTLYIYIFGGVFWLLTALIVFIESSSKKKSLPFISPIEAVIYPIFFVVIAFRILLQWRLTVFPDIGTFSLSQNNYFKYTVAFSIIFLCIRLAISLYQKSNVKVLENLYQKAHNFFTSKTGGLLKFAIYCGLHLVIIGIIIIISTISAFDSISRIINIYIPILLFLFFSFLFSEATVIKSKKDKTYFNYLFNPYRIANTLITLLGLGLLDGGYANLFLLLIIAYLPFGIYANVEANNKWISIVISLCAFLTLVLSGRIMLFLFRNPWVLIMAGIAFVAFCAYAILQHFSLNKKNNRQALMGALGTFVILLVISFILGVPKFIESKSYALARVAVVTKKLETLISEANFNENKDISVEGASNLPLFRILNASENRSLISAYYESNDLSVDPSEKEKYFRVKDHYQAGAFLAFQISDLSVVRFIIAEHSEILVFLILSLFALIPLYIFYFNNGELNARKRLALRASLLIFCSGLFVWLTSTNRYVFFGQDFPLISLNSKLTLLLTCSLLLIAIIFSKDYNRNTNNRYRKYNGYLPYFNYLLVPVGLLALMGFVGSANYQEEVDAYKLSLSKTIRLVEDYNSKLSSMQNNNERVNGVPFLDLSIEERINNCPFDSNVDSYSPFAVSTFNNFAQKIKNKQNPRNIIYAVQTGEEAGKPIYKLQVNRTYRYTPPPSFMSAQWKGHLLSASSQKSMKLKGTKNRRVDKIDLDQFSHIDYDGSSSNIDETIKVWSIPKEWILGADKSVLVVSAYDDGGAKSFALNNYKKQFESSRSDEHSLALAMTEDDDVLQIYDGQQTIDELKLMESYSEFVMKNMWINGKQRAFYPAGSDLMWAYQFSQSVKNTWNNDIASADKNIRLTLDTKLCADISKIYDDFYHYHPSHFGLCIVDSKGRLRVIEDHDNTWGVKAVFDPNDLNAIYKYNSYRQTMRSISDERKELGNINLLNLQRGPGSTLKPLVAGAIISKYKMDWHKLYIAPTQCIEKEVYDEEFKLINYANRRIYPWNLDQDPISYTNYIPYSSNEFHSLMVFLGSYTPTDMNNIKATLQGNLPNENSILVEAYGENCTYPTFDMNDGYGSRLSFKADKWPRTIKDREGPYFGNINSLIATGLEDNLTIPTISSTYNKPIDFYQSTPEILAKGSYSTAYSYPEPSNFYQRNRSESRFFSKGLRNSSLGGDPWRISPLKVAEMTGALFSNNVNFRATIDANVTPPLAKPFIMGEEGGWSNSKELYTYYQQHLFKGMRDCLTRGTGSGGFGRTGGTVQDKQGNTYYLYGKSGTTNQASLLNGLSDKFFLMVVSKNDLTTLAPDQYDDNPFVVLMFSCLECVRREGDGQLYNELLANLYNRGVLQTLVNAESFQEVMKGN